MSGKAQECVWEHSPYTLAKRLIHLAAANKTAEDYGHYVWASQATLAKAARVDRKTVNAGLNQFVSDGWIELINWDNLPENVQAMVPDNRVNVYRFLLCEPCGKLWNLPSRHGESSDTSASETWGISGHDVGNLMPRHGESRDPVLLLTKEELKSNEKGDFANRLCNLLATNIEEHRGKAPKITSAWKRDMDLLIRRGPVAWAAPEAIPPGIIAAAIKGIFTKLTVHSNSGFCWADQIRSPSNLRAKWDVLVVELRDKPMYPRGATANGSQPGMGFMLNKVKERYEAG